MGRMELSSSGCAEIGVPLDLRQVSQESLELPKRSQDTCCMMGNVGWLWSQCRELGFISSCFGVHQTILRICLDIRVLLEF